MALLSFPKTPRDEWDDVDEMIARTIHELDCRRWPHRLALRLEVHRQSVWNRWIGGLAAMLCDPYRDPDGD